MVVGADQKVLTDAALARATPAPKPSIDYLRFDERDAVFFGILAPFLRASDRPIAIACLRLFTVPPEPLFSVPALRFFIALSTVDCALGPYFAMVYLLAANAAC